MKKLLSDKKRPKKRSRAKDRTTVKAMSVRSSLNGLPEHIAHLYEATARYVEHEGGSALVVGGIEVQNYTRSINYTVGVKVTGRKPLFLE